MTSTAYSDIGPTAPSRVALARRIRKSREYLKMAEERLEQGELGRAEYWLQRVSDEAALSVED